MSDRTFLKRVVVVALTGVALLGFWYLRSIFMMGFTALMIAIGVSVPARWLQLRGLSRGLAVLTSGVLVGVVAIILALIIVPTLIQQLVAILVQLPDMIRHSIEAYESLRASSDVLRQTLPELDFSSVDQLESALGLKPDSLSNLARTVVGTGAYSLFSGLGLFGSLLANLFFIIFIAAFFLYEPLSYIKASLYLVPTSYRSRLLQIWDELYHTLITWISAQFLSIAVTAGLVFIILGLILDMPFPLIVAIFAGFATFIPNIGAFLPMIPITIFTLADKPSWLFVYLGVYLLIQLAESNVITPMIVKSELDIPAGGLMLFQLVAAAIFGALGLLLAVPMLAILIALTREIYSYDMLGLRDQEVQIEMEVSSPMRLKKPAQHPSYMDNDRKTSQVEPE